MSSELDQLSDHIKERARRTLAHANWLASYSHMDNWQKSDLSVTVAAHAAELFFKASIAEVDPLGIFVDPPSRSELAQPGAVEELLQTGRTIRWSEIPKTLLDVTGLSMPSTDLFREIGRLRNRIIHCGLPPNIDIAAMTRRFIYAVIDPFIHDQWGDYALVWCDDEEHFMYGVEPLLRQKLLFHVPPGLAEYQCSWDFDWDNTAPEYREEMQRRIALSS